jgi:hypothetical protein
LIVSMVSKSLQLPFPYPRERLFSTQRWFVSKNRIAAETCLPIRSLETAYMSQYSCNKILNLRNNTMMHHTLYSKSWIKFHSLYTHGLLLQLLGPPPPPQVSWAANGVLWRGKGFLNLCTLLFLSL